MNELLSNKLKEEFPSLLSNISYIECGDGWYNLISKLCMDITVVEPDAKCFQIKEKFGGLRFYIGSYSDIRVDQLIEKAEEESYEICEVCSQPGKPGGKYWISTLCDVCRVERK